MNKGLKIRILSIIVAVLVISSGVGFGSVRGQSLLPLVLENNMSNLSPVVSLNSLPPLDQNRPQKTEFALFALG